VQSAGLQRNQAVSIRESPVFLTQGAGSGNGAERGAERVGESEWWGGLILIVAGRRCDVVISRRAWGVADCPLWR
jgi:hypothetical protein